MHITPRVQLIKELRDFTISGLSMAEYAEKNGYSKRDAEIILTAAKAIQAPDIYTEQINTAKEVMRYKNITAPDLSTLLGLRNDRMACLFRLERKLTAKSFDELKSMLPLPKKNLTE